ncbi:galactosamine-6-phosphate isomerase [Larkinella arboricola]|uniref:Galactosamine-6-phosphate isomerase n=1 Tax=Larkinella arboricola TaxID=643671 RepID=A0A327WYJ9_LARAB|nr:glucosamine-6-phosphate deaminase [Larkinella arboricola]RAJ97630.1 galactosamine-6-phosphate isomerase [Larkinella arboricola]
MNFQIFPDYETLSRHTAQRIADLLNRKPDALICAASGDTPVGTYRALVQLVKEGQTRIDRCTFVGLDEWVGLGPESEGSCSNYLQRELFGPLNIGPEQYRMFDAKAADLEAECELMNQFVDERGGFDLILVGVGLNGHIALNEPGTPFTLKAHVSELAETTITVGQKYFNEPTPLTLGLTTGLQQLMDAREAILIASGSKKAPVIKTALKGPVTEEFPASIMQTHPNGFVWVDQAAAGDLA